MQPEELEAGPEEVVSGQRQPMNLRQIEVFRAIMTAGSISAAGRLLCVSQPAISRVLALTESRLGFKLFERAKSRLLPTPEARRLFAEIDLVYGGIQRVNDLAISLAQSGGGMLKVASSASFGQRMMPMTLARLRTRNAQARVDYRSVTFDELTTHLLVGHAHIGVSMVAPVHPNLDSVKLGEADIVCVMPKSHPLAGREHVQPADLRAAPWIGYPADTPLGKSLASFFGMSSTLVAPIEVHSPVTACAFVQQGLGLGIVDTWCLTPEMQQSLAVLPIVPPARISIWVTYSNVEPLPLLARRFLAALKAVIEAETPSNFIAAP